MIDKERYFSDKFLLAATDVIWDALDMIEGTLTGGIGPRRNLLSMEVTWPDTVEVKYDYPETCGLSDVVYHVLEPHKVRTETFRFTKDGIVMMDDKPFFEEYENDCLVEEEVCSYKERYKEMFDEYVNTYHYRELLRDYFSDLTVQGRIEKRGRYLEAEWWMKKIYEYSDEDIREIYDEEYWQANHCQM